MRIIRPLFIVVFLFGCKNQTNEYIQKFENILGERKTKALDLLVFDFENNLDKVYPNISLQKAYEQYLKDLIDPKETDWDKFRFLSDETRAEFENSGLKKEVYNLELEFVEEKKDSLLTYYSNGVGKYMRAIYEIKEHDTLMMEYYKRREIGGLMQNEIFVNGILHFRPDFNNYFHKRIVVIEFTY
ncbi:hypothetical protein [Winogradskyella ouciana]|uniref:Uncharacterized protein n=1 Tax=Winogradskyella ouciana TaxID=2608631 RepID=A0A7K1G8C7_9FLAO|nr:hypothetical protein [Winogradskyella ouciana]MTE25391.1 hypothetical protein [Winogradskyella ouciana]